MKEIIQNKINRLAEILKFPKKDLQLLELALTHRSKGEPNNERLEFLGDSVLNFVIGAELYKIFPKANEGILTSLRATLVREETLVELANELKLGEYLILGAGERRTGANQRGSILADAFEAIIGAILCSAGFERAKDFLLECYKNKLISIDEQAIEKDPKTKLQELLQSKRLKLPEYEVVEIKGVQHDQTFHVKCKVSLLSEPVLGIGNTRRRAEQNAAEKILSILF